MHLGECVEVEDIGSAHGTLVNGQPLPPHTRRLLIPGAPVQIGATLLVLQDELRPRAPSSSNRSRLDTHAAFERKLSDACIKAARDKTTFRVLRIRPVMDPGLALDALAPTDVVARYAPDELEVLLIDGDSKSRARALVDECRTQAMPTRIECAIAQYGQDGRSPDALLNAASPSSTPIAAVRDPATQSIRRLVEQVARSRVPLLIMSEPGAGKTTLARFAQRAAQGAGPNLRVDCGALDAGAFAHAISNALDQNATESVCLDDVDALDMESQIVLQRALERPHGRKWIISTASGDIEAAAAAGRFIPALLERLRTVAVMLPPVRDRRIEFGHLIDQLARRCMDGRPVMIDDETMQLLRRYDWPGNLHEMQSVLQRAMTRARGATITASCLPAEKFDRMRPSVNSFEMLRDSVASADADWSEKRGHIMEVLSMVSGNQTRAARKLGVSRRTLVSWLVRYRIPRPHKPLPGPKTAVEVADLRDTPAPTDGELDAWTRERQRIIEALESCSGNQTRAAKMLQISRRTLVSRMITHRIPRPRKPLPGEMA